MRKNRTLIKLLKNFKNILVIRLEARALYFYIDRNVVTDIMRIVLPLITVSWWPSSISCKLHTVANAIKIMSKTLIIIEPNFYD